MKNAAIFYHLKLQHFVWLLLLWAAIATALPGCAAMRRTWQFSGEPVGLGIIIDPTLGPELLFVRVDEAAVSQRRLAIKLTFTNSSAQAIAITCENATLTLPDGDEFTRSVGSLQQNAENKLAAIGIGSKAGPQVLQPGASAPLEISISQGRRDLRRFAVLVLRLPDLKIDGQPAALLPLQLHAPADAPLGEDI